MLKQKHEKHKKLKQALIFGLDQKTTAVTIQEPTTQPNDETYTIYVINME